MPKFTLFWITTYCGGLLAAFFHPVYGTYTYLFEYYLRPSLHWWGKAHLPMWRWNLIISIVTIAAYLLRRQSMEPLGPFPKGPVTALALLFGWMIVMSPVAVSPDLSWGQVYAFLALGVFFCLVIGTVRSAAGFDGFIAMHIAGAGWWGWEAYKDPSREASRLVNVGSGDTLGDNFAASHLLTVLPFVAVYLLMQRKIWLRLLVLITAPFIVNVFILCNSRGAMVGMVAAFLWGLFVVPNRHRLRMLIGGVGMAVALLVLADPEFIQRQRSTANYETDSSAQERLESWRAGLRLLADYPLGAGGKGFDELSPVYNSVVVGYHGGAKRAPHNTVILVMAEWGIPGLILYCGYFVAMLHLLRKVRRQAAEGFWFYRALALELSIVGLFISGLFSDRFYGEAPFWMGGLTVALARLYAEEAAGTAVANPIRHPMASTSWPGTDARESALAR